MTHTDSYYAIGKSHTYCQDYADHSSIAAVLSDGCSRVYDINNKQINVRTDVGARILALTALSEFNEQHLTLDEHFKQIAILANRNRKSLELPKSTLSATLLAVTHKDGLYNMIICGDGAVCARFRETKEWIYATYKYDPLPPIYPTHWLDRSTPHGCTITIYRGTSMNTDISRNAYWYEDYLSTDRYDTVLIFSDGVFSFTKDNKPCPFETIIDKLLDFKRMKGCFVVRNLKAILGELESEGYIHQDDISAAGMHIE